MGKAVLPKNLTGTMPAGKAAAAFLIAKRKEVAAYAPAAMTGHPEGGHDMRVAGKRLREAMRLFRKLLPRKARARALGMVEQLNDSLGRVRDLDVLTGHLEALREQVPTAAERLAELEADWTEQRGHAQQDLVALWKRLKGGARLEAQIEELAGATAKRSEELNRLPLESFAYLSVRARANQVAQRLAALREKQDPATLHLLRLSVKRLKYTMEPFLQALPALSKPYAAVTEAQESAGLTHDFDVLEAAVAGFFQESGTQRTRPAQQALKALREQRKELYATAMRRMDELVRTEWRQGLMDALD